MTATAQIKYQHVGEAIRSKRKILGMTQDTLSDLVGTSFTNVSAIENGRDANLTLDTLSRYANALQCHISDLLLDISMDKLETLTGEPV